MNSRKIANDIVTCVLQEGVTLTEAFNAKLPTQLDERDVAFIKQCCFGVLRWHDQLRYIKKKLLNSPLKPKDKDIDTLMLLGLFQLIHTEVPDHAAVSETVMVCRLQKKSWATGLMNKCLRRFINEKEKLMTETKKQDAANYAHPAWLIKKIQAAWPNDWQAILEANNQKPPLWLRVNQQKSSTKDYVDLLHQKNIEVCVSDHVKSAVLLPRPLPVSAIPKFSEGFSSVQDLSGQFAANLLDLKKDQRVLDACAAPGSKTSHILETQPNLAKLVIVDKDAERLLKVKENISRLQLDHRNSQLVLADATHTKEWWDGVAYDRILLDAPCSATGVIRRHPDIKVLRTEAEINHISQVQMQLLIALWKLLKKGGKLLYATCSILPEENEQIIANFIAHHTDAKAEKIELSLGLPQKYGHQLLPQTGGTDGFYYALLSKK